MRVKDGAHASRVQVNVPLRQALDAPLTAAAGGRGFTPIARHRRRCGGPAHAQRFSFTGQGQMLEPAGQGQLFGWLVRRRFSQHAGDATLQGRFGQGAQSAGQVAAVALLNVAGSVFGTFLQPCDGGRS